VQHGYFSFSPLIAMSAVERPQPVDKAMTNRVSPTPKHLTPTADRTKKPRVMIVASEGLSLVSFF
jgi:hypothetical protein